MILFPGLAEFSHVLITSSPIRNETSLLITLVNRMMIPSTPYPSTPSILATRMPCSMLIAAAIPVALNR